MTYEDAEFRSEDPICVCLGANRRPSPGSRNCSNCGREQGNISGRDSIRDPEPYLPSLKPIARAYVKKHGTDEWVDLGVVPDPFIAYDYSEAEEALLKAFSDHFPLPHGSYDVPGHSDGCDEVS